MREVLSKLKYWAATLLFVLMSSIMTGGPAFADGNDNPPGNNGTLQVHEKGDQDFKNSSNPHVCTFNFEAFDLDAGQTGNVTITPQSPTTTNGTPDGNPLVLSLTTNNSGDGATVYVNDAANGPALQNGHYKATLDNKFGTDQNGKAKSKIFWVGCSDIEPTVATQASSANVHVGDKVHDVATLTGDFNHGDVTGTVNFYLCGPNATTNPSCSNGGTHIGSSVTISNGIATSSDYTVTAAGNYCFRASYSPYSNSNYDLVTHTNLTTECFNATPKPTAISVPLAPDMTDPCGLSNAAWNVPSDTTSLVWTIDTNGHLIATAKTGFVFTDGTTSHDYGVARDSNALCQVNVPATPSVDDPCGLGNATWVQPTDTSTVTWTITNGHLVATTTAGYEFTDGHTAHDYGVAPDSGDACTPSPIDVCTNLGGLQTQVPDGYRIKDGKCVKCPIPVDVCINLEGFQKHIPKGYKLKDGLCVPCTPPPVDVCANIEGIQPVVPEGMVSDGDGGCVTEAPQQNQNATPGDVVFTDATCNTSAFYTVPATTGVIYKDGNGNVGTAGNYNAIAGQTVDITAYADSGYALTGTTNWSHTFTAAQNCNGHVLGTSTTTPPTTGQALAASTTQPQLADTGTSPLLPTLLALLMPAVALTTLYYKRASQVSSGE